MEQQANADKQLERSLKALLKESEDLAPEFQTIAKTWKMVKRADIEYSQCSDPYPCGVSKQDYLTLAVDKPEARMPGNCDVGLWQKVLRWYSSKAQSSNAIIQMQAEMLELRSALESVTSECDRCDQPLFSAVAHVFKLQHRTGPCHVVAVHMFRLCLQVLQKLQRMH